MVEQGGRGGVADYTACLTAALARRGLPVVLATAEDHLQRPAPGVTVRPIFRYLRTGSRAARAVRRMHASWAVNGVRFLAAIPVLVRAAWGRPIVHLQGWERNSLGLIATLALRATGARIVYTAHNTFERGSDLDGARVIGALAQATIVHTRADLPRVNGPVVQIPHGHYGAIAGDAPPVDPEVARHELGIAADVPVVLLFGVLRPDKGLIDLLQAAAALPAWHVLVAGEDHGALAPATEALQALGSRVTVRPGFASTADTGRLFAAADVVALPYRQASQSGVLHLAYGFGRPVIAYPVGGLAEGVIAGQTGWLCPAPTPAALAETLAEAAAAGRSELHRRGAAGRRWAAEAFDWDQIAARTEELYVRVLAGLPVSDATGASDASRTDG